MWLIDALVCLVWDLGFGIWELSSWRYGKVDRKGECNGRSFFSFFCFDEESSITRYFTESSFIGFVRREGIKFDLT
jgi:hypothetical protein